ARKRWKEVQIMLFNGFLHTGTRCFAHSSIVSIDLWKTEQQAQLTLDEIGKVMLDEDESRIIRDWAAGSMEAAITDAQGERLAVRCALQGQIDIAQKLNRAASRKAKRQPAQQAKAVNVVDIDVWKAAQRPAETSPVRAA